MTGYDMDAPADVYIATQAGTRSGGARILWRMSVEDAQKVCSHPSTSGTGQGGEWMLCWTTYGLADITGHVAEREMFAADDGRFDDLFEELGVRVLVSRHLLLNGGAVLTQRPPAPEARPSRPIDMPEQLGLFGEDDAA